MITNFNELTADLTKEERDFTKALCDGFMKYTKANPIKAPVIVERINASGKLPKKVTEVRLRKMCNYIRTKGLIPLVATSAGYYTDYSREEIKKQVQSLEERARSIQSAADGLKKFL